MPDLSSLEGKVRDRGAELFRAAMDGMEEKLRTAAPTGDPDPLGRPKPGPRLRETFFRATQTQTSSVFSQRLGFTAPQATYSNDLMPPHVITPRRPGYPLLFWSYGSGELVRAYKVEHPGNINAVSRGWFDDNTTQASWLVELVASQ